MHVKPQAKSYKCNDCNINFASEKKFNTHRKAFHPKKQIFEECLPFLQKAYQIPEGIEIKPFCFLCKKTEMDVVWDLTNWLFVYQLDEKYAKRLLLCQNCIKNFDSIFSKSELYRAILVISSKFLVQPPKPAISKKILRAKKVKKNKKTKSNQILPDEKPQKSMEELLRKRIEAERKLNWKRSGDKVLLQRTLNEINRELKSRFNIGETEVAHFDPTKFIGPGPRKHPKTPDWKHWKR